MKSFLWVGFALACVGVGCASEPGQIAGGAGGSGVAVTGPTTASTTSTTIASSTGTGLPCGQDCSTIEVPVCFEATCNAQTHACEIHASSDETPCEDGLFCTVDDACSDGVCQPGKAFDCGADIDECNGLTCDEEEHGCLPHPLVNGVSCTTTAPCEDNAICQNGHCLGAPKDCSTASDECNPAVCDPNQGGLCVPMVGNDGGSCTSGDLCMENKTCSAGQCVGGTPIDCSFETFGCFVGVCDPSTGFCNSAPVPPGGGCIPSGDECHEGACDTGGNCIASSTPGNDGVSCQGTDVCKFGTTCSAGQCVGGQPVDCSFADFGCFTGVCDPTFGFCDSVPIGVGESCPEATDACHQGICDVSGACVGSPANDGGGCDDGSVCTVNDTCSAGTCSGIIVGAGTVYFSEDFSDNSAGWTLDSEWQIGPAMASDGTQGGGTFPDPALDNTATADNGVAGVAIGGHAVQSVHPFYYLTSPVYDVSTIPGPLFVDYRRWLNSDYPPYMSDDVEVFDGTSWVTVWSNAAFDQVIAEDSWTQQSAEITAYKNAGFRVRFGFAIGSSGVYKVGSWNIDDVAISSAPCN